MNGIRKETFSASRQRNFIRLLALSSLLVDKRASTSIVSKVVTSLLNVRQVGFVIKGLKITAEQVDETSRHGGNYPVGQLVLNSNFL